MLVTIRTQNCASLHLLWAGFSTVRFDRIVGTVPGWTCTGVRLLGTEPIATADPVESGNDDDGGGGSDSDGEAGLSFKERMAALVKAASKRFDDANMDGQVYPSDHYGLAAVFSRHADSPQQTS